MENPNNLNDIKQNPPHENTDNTLREPLLGLTVLNHDVVLLNYGNVLIRKDYQNLKIVCLVCGGVADPDLSYAYFVGKGMLTAAILSKNVAPNSRQVLRTLRELNEKEKCGILVIARGGPEMFSFGLAVERLNADCKSRVKLLPVDDYQQNTCGFILLMKILGAKAENGEFYDEIVSSYERIISEIISVPLNYAQVNGDDMSVTLTMDFGFISKILDKKSETDLRLHPGVPVVALINVSKFMTKSAELELVKQVVERFREIGTSILRIYAGNFISAAPNTATLTVLKIYNRKILEFLDAPCNAPGWQQLAQHMTEATLQNEIPGLLTNQGKERVLLKGPHFSEFQSSVLVKAVQFACEALISCERQLNIIDSERSQGNVGTRFKKLAEHVKKRLSENRLTTNCPYAFLKKMSVMSESALGGTMGSIYGVLFESAAKVFGETPVDDPVTSVLWAKALISAEDSIKNYVTISKTMYVPIKACKKAVLANEQLEFLDLFGLGVSQAEEAAQKTRKSTLKYPDAGAHAVGIWMRAVYEGVKVMCLGETTAEKMVD